MDDRKSEPGTGGEPLVDWSQVRPRPSGDCCCPTVFQFIFADKVVNEVPKVPRADAVVCLVLLLLLLRPATCPPPVCPCCALDLHHRKKSHKC